MKQVKFLGEVIGFSSIVPILVIAKLTYSAGLETGGVEKRPANKSMVSQKPATREHPATPDPGLINSKFIILNY
jgi:hypothetical protein